MITTRSNTETWQVWRRTLPIDGIQIEFYVDNRRRCGDGAWNHVHFRVDSPRNNNPCNPPGWRRVYGPATRTIAQGLRWAIRDIRQGRFLNIKPV